MNKVKMGKFLRELRKEKKLSLEDLSNEFNNEYLTVSTNAISSWENGKTIPDINNLNFLASFYGVSIDEILDGEKHNKVDFETIYYLHKPYSSIVSLFGQDSTMNDVQVELTKQGIRIKARVKELIFKYVYSKASQIEIDELVFLLENYYNLNPDLTIRTFLQTLSGYRNYGIRRDDMWWMIQKDFRPIGKLNVSFGDISDEYYESKTVDIAVESLEDWEKDMLLAMIQRKDPIYLDPTQWNSKAILKYQEEHNKAFDPEQITKNTIRYLIKKGACINTAYLGYDKLEEIEVRPIEEYEYLYNNFEKPISFIIEEDGTRKYYQVENNYKNHVLINYRYQIVKPLVNLGYTYDEIIKMIIENEEIPDDVYLRDAKKKGLDIDRDFSLIKADVHWDYLYMQDQWEKCREEYLAYSKDDESNSFSHKNIRDNVLLNGGTMKSMNLEWIGGIEPAEVEDYVLTKNSKMSLSEFKLHRDHQRTNELLESLDELSLEDVRDEFFWNGGKNDD